MPPSTWSISLGPKQPYRFTPTQDVMITNLCLGWSIADATGRTAVQLAYKRAGQNTVTNTVLATLTVGRNDNARVEVELTSGSEYVLEALGPNQVFLTGFLVDSEPEIELNKPATKKKSKQKSEAEPAPSDGKKGSKKPRKAADIRDSDEEPPSSAAAKRASALKAG